MDLRVQVKIHDANEVICGKDLGICIMGFKLLLGARLVDLEELNLEDEVGLRGDDTGDSVVSVGEGVRDVDRGLLTEGHSGNGLIPTLDDTTNTDGSDKG